MYGKSSAIKLLKKWHLWVTWVTLIIPCASLATEHDWPQARGNAQNVASIQVEAPNSGRGKPWTFDGSGRVWGYTPGMTVWSSPALAVVDQRAVVVVGSYDKNVYCLDATSGELIWKFTTGDGVYSAPTVHTVDGRSVVFATSADRLVYAIDASLGRRLWIHSVKDYRPTIGGARLSAPVVGKAQNQDAVFFGHWVWDRSLTKNLQQAGLSALRASDGKLLWKTDLGDNEIATPVFTQIGGRGWLFVGIQNGNVLALDADTGQIKWKRTELDAIRNTPAVTSIKGKAVVIIASKYGLVRALWAQTGKQIWQYKADDRITGSTAVARIGDKNLVFVTSFDRTIFTLEVETGAPVWRYWTRGPIYASPTLLLDDDSDGANSVVVTASWDHHLHCVTAADGTYLWLAFTGKPMWDTLGQGDSTWSSPVAARINNEWMVYFGSYSGVFYGLSVKQLSLETDKAKTSNFVFWVSLPIAIISVTGFAMLLTRRYRKRMQSEQQV